VVCVQDHGRGGSHRAPSRHRHLRTGDRFSHARRRRRANSDSAAATRLARGPFLGGDVLGDESFSGLFASLPEERRQPGYFTDGVYGIAPIILDSANGETLAFIERFRARFGHDPLWMAVAGYDAALTAVAAMRATSSANSDIKARRAAAVRWLASLNSLDRALPGLLGPIWFDTEHGGHRAVRIGRFERGRLESAPLQIVSVPNPDRAEIKSGAVFEMEPGSWGRKQRVVYSGMFLNEIARVDIAQSTFTADLYVWMRFARGRRCRCFRSNRNRISQPCSRRLRRQSTGREGRTGRRHGLSSLESAGRFQERFRPPPLPGRSPESCDPVFQCPRRVGSAGLRPGQAVVRNWRRSYSARDNDDKPCRHGSTRGPAATDINPPLGGSRRSATPQRRIPFAISPNGSRCASTSGATIW